MTAASDTGDEQGGAYRIEDLSRLSGTTVRTIRAYTDRGLLPKPERHGRANVYDGTHLDRLRQIADLLERGYSLASIKELLAAWDAGTGLGGVLGLVGEVDRPWSDEQPVRLSLPDLVAAFGGAADLSAVEEALALGVLEAVPDRDDEFAVPSPTELAVAVELHAAGVPLNAITGHLRELRGQVEHISERFLEFTTRYVFQRFLQHPPNDADAAEAADLVRRLRPLAQQTVDAELARAMRLRATAHVRRHLGNAALAVPPALPGAGSAGPGTPGGAGTTPPTEPTGPTGQPQPPRQPEPPDATESPEPPGTSGPPEPSATPRASELSRPPEPSGLPEPPGSPEASGPPQPCEPSEVSGSPEPSGLPEAPEPSGPPEGSVSVLLPAATVAAVRGLVGAAGVPAFVAAAADREVAARRMDDLARGPRGPRDG